MEEIKYNIALNHFPKFGPVRTKLLKNYFENLKNAFLSTAGELEMAGIEKSIAQEFISVRPKINPDAIIELLHKEKINAIALDDIKYPKLLKEIYTPPEILYYKGSLNCGEFPLAIVGSRKFTNYGKQIVEKMSKELAQSGLSIISGLALGIDSMAHSGALEVGGRTIAVLGSGLNQNNLYPAQNRYLANKIIESGGAIISEFTPSTPPLRHHFPQRNRIISGLSLGTLVIEAGEKSGSLITANYALEQSREIFAVPGNIYSLMSKGTNQLIKLGATPATCTEDIIDALNLAHVTSDIKKVKIIPETKNEKIIFGFLSHEPTHADKLTKLTGLDASTINSTLTIMEIKGIAKNMGGMEYVLSS